MPRRTHKKSRRGCADCKRRHIKCDENRPQCVNCQTARLRCAFSSEESPQSAQGPEPSGPSETSTPIRRQQDVSPAKPNSVSTTSNIQESDLNLDHLELLHHYCTATFMTLASGEALQDIWKGPVIRMSLRFPFVMHELLAIAALHLAHCRPEKAGRYHTKSTELQSQALKSFNSLQKDIDASSCAPVLIFSSLLPLHILADPSRTQGLNSNQYLDHVTQCLVLMRNVQQLVIRDWFQHLKETELSPLFNIEHPAKPYDIPQPCVDLANLPNSANLSKEAKDAYDSAIDRLQWVFAMSRVPYERHSTIRWLLAWPVQLSEKYLESLDQRRPEALVILAYFGVLMQFYRDCWAVGDSGRLLVGAIQPHVGSHWAEWMEWPISFLTTSPG